MKSFFVNLVVVACVIHEGAAFSPLPPPRPSLTGHPTPLHSTTVSSSSSSSSRNDATMSNPPRAPTVHELREMETIRKELIEKYIALGHDDAYAAREVSYFLEDSERSAQYVEMRRVAMARGNDLGIENLVQFAAAFMVGMVGSWVLNYWHALQAASPDGGLPWIS